jgi:hypothetical protein
VSRSGDSGLRIPLIDDFLCYRYELLSRSGDSGLEIPFIDDFLQDIGDGCCLAVLVHFYCPDVLRLNGK